MENTKKFLYIMLYAALHAHFTLESVGIANSPIVIDTLRYDNKLYSTRDIETYIKAVELSKRSDLTVSIKNSIINTLKTQWQTAQHEANLYQNADNGQEQTRHSKKINDSLSAIESVIDMYALQKLPTNAPSYKYGIMLAGLVGLGSAAYLGKGYITKKLYEQLPLVLEHPIIKNFINKQIIHALSSPETYKTLLRIPLSKPIIKQATEQLLNVQFPSISPFE
jgi:hypothetical protein